MVSDGWLEGEHQNAIHLRIHGDALKFYKTKHVQQEYRLKVVPLDLRNWDVSSFEIIHILLLICRMQSLMMMIQKMLQKNQRPLL